MSAIISVKNLGIRYTVFKSGGKSLRRNILQLVTGNLSRQWFWALKDVTFDLNEGDTLGVIGSNGSGKSTLCMSLAQILHPDEGEVQVNGTVSPILALGSGFNRDMTGRENIFLSGALMGLSQQQSREMEPSIIEFAEIGDFIDNPVRTYSSGMKARLAFAIAPSIEPDVLLLDEILGVGDVAFKQKSEERMHQLMDRARGIVLVSHTGDVIRELCNVVLWLHHGQVMAYGPTDEIVTRYEKFQGKIEKDSKLKLQ